MAMTKLPFHLFGFRVMGDVSGITVYTNKKFQKVFYKKAPPDKPASPAQRARRDLFGKAIAAWRLLSSDQKRDLEDATRALSLCLTGQNLFTSCCLRSDAGTYATIER